MKKQPVKWIQFDGMSWPLPDRDLVWVIAHGKPTKENLLQAASILSAYWQMIFDPVKKRQNVIRKIRAHLNQEANTDGRED